IGLTSSLVARILDAERRTSRTRDLSCLRKVGLGSEPVSARHMQAFAALLRQHGAAAVDVLAGYGTTETGVLVTGSRLGLSSDADAPPALG
ncbi:AMP-binding protein, partial [Acinetobacter baumannii]